MSGKCEWIDQSEKSTKLVSSLVGRITGAKIQFEFWSIDLTLFLYMVYLKSLPFHWSWKGRFLQSLSLCASHITFSTVPSGKLRFEKSFAKKALQINAANLPKFYCWIYLFIHMWFLPCFCKNSTQRDKDWRNRPL